MSGGGARTGWCRQEGCWRCLRSREAGRDGWVCTHGRRSSRVCLAGICCPLRLNGPALARSPTAADRLWAHGAPPTPSATHLGVGQQLLPLGLQRSRGIGGHILQRLLAGLVGAGGDSAHVDGHCRAEATEGAGMVVSVCRKLGSCRPQGSCRVPGERRSAQLRPLPPAQAPLGPAAHRCAGGGGRSWRACRRAGRVRARRQAVCVQAANGGSGRNPSKRQKPVQRDLRAFQGMAGRDRGAAGAQARRGSPGHSQTGGGGSKHGCEGGR